MSAAESFAPVPDFSQQAGQAVTIFVLVVTSAVTVIVIGLGRPLHTLDIQITSYIVQNSRNHKQNHYKLI